MKRQLVLTMLGPDQPGIVKQLSELLAKHDANWLESRMANLAGEFAGILRAEVDEKNYEKLTHDLSDLENGGVQFLIKDARTDPQTTGAKDPSGRQLELEVLGTDREGIVRDITAVLAQHSINVEELSTETFEAPMSSEPLFKAIAQLTAASNTDLERVQSDIEDIANDLMTELRVKI